MAVEKTDINTFLALSENYPVLDVRSPGEFSHAHIPGAYNLPLFSDEERRVVGTAYKQESREAAIKIGLEYFGVKMRGMVEEAERLTGDAQAAINKNTDQFSPVQDKTVLIHCWRGGMRSAAIAWLLGMYGFKVYTLAGGYKRFRQHVLETFKQPFRFNMLAGYTGSGKTSILRELASRGERVIDLEALAHHRGSAFGGIGQLPQPSQEMFENRFALELRSHAAAENGIWLEDESQRIGTVTIPNEIWSAIRRSNLYFLNIPVEARLDHLSREYGELDKDKLVLAIQRIQKRLGGLEAKTAIRNLLENNTRECFRTLLTYYDKYYRKGLLSRENLDVHLTEIEAEQVNEKENASRFIAALHNKNRDAGTKSPLHAY